MKRKLLALIMATALTSALFVGCGGSKGAETSGDKGELVTEIKEETNIEIWHYLNGEQAKVLDELVDDFNKTNGKKITVKASPQGGIGDLNKKVVTAAQSNSLPAIINVYPDTASGLIDQKKIFDLAPYINHKEVGMADDLKNDFIPSFIDEVKQWDGGHQYGMPLSKSTEVLYVNKTKLEEIGYKVEDLQNLTMTKLAEISKKSKEKLGIPGFGADSSSNAFISTLKMDSKDFVSMKGEVDVNNEWVKTYMNFFKEQTEKGYFRIPGEDKFLSGPFSNGKVLMYQGSTSGASHIKNNDAFEIAVVEVPSFEGKNKAVIQQGASLFVTNDITPEQKFAAYEFIKFATSKENSAKFAAKTGYLPVRKSSAETEIMKETLKNEKSLYAKVYPHAQKALEYAYYTPAVNNANTARNIAKEKFDAYVSGNIKDADTLIKELEAEVKTSVGRK